MTDIGVREQTATKDEVFSSLTARPAAGVFGVGRCQIGRKVYFSDGVDWYSSENIFSTVADRPAASTFGVGACQVGGVTYVSDGTNWYAQPIILAQAALPLILPSSGSIGDNGALSGVATLPDTFARCFMYFPANSIAAGVAAGFYYVAMSSATAGTIYNNAYTTGTPTAPTTATAFATTGPGAFTQTTASDINMLQVSLPAGLLGAAGRVEIETEFSLADTATQKTIKAKLATTVVGTAGTTTSGDVSGRLASKVINRAANAQVIVSGGTGVPSYGGVGVSATANTYGSVDTSEAQTIKLTGLITTAATEFIVLESYSIRVFPA